MRLDAQSLDTIRRAVRELAGSDARVRLFGSRLDDTARGGDIDLLVEMTEPAPHPAQLASLLSARISRALQGRGVDVIIAAPNLSNLPLHEHARSSGVLL